MTVEQYINLTAKWIIAGRPDDLADELDDLWHKMTDEERTEINSCLRTKVTQEIKRIRAGGYAKGWRVKEK